MQTNSTIAAGKSAGDNASCSATNTTTARNSCAPRESHQAAADRSEATASEHNKIGPILEEQEYVEEEKMFVENANFDLVF